MREWAVLEYLLQHAARVVSKQQIIDAILPWGDDLTLNAVEVYVSRLRLKLADAGIAIRTIRGFGYMLEAGRMTSIRLRLLKWLVGPILLVNLAGAALTYLLAWTPAQLAFDQGLPDAAAALAARVRAGPRTAPRSTCRAQAEQVLRADEPTPSISRCAGATARCWPATPISRRCQRTPACTTRSLRGEPVRVATRQRAGPAATRIQVAVAKTLRKRAQIRSAIVRALVLLEGAVHAWRWSGWSGFRSPAACCRWRACAPT